MRFCLPLLVLGVSLVFPGVHSHEEFMKSRRLSGKRSPSSRRCEDTCNGGRSFVFTMTNANTSNKIVAYERVDDGKLEFVQMVDTGGVGGLVNVVNETTKTPVPAPADDPLGSQNSMIVSSCNKKCLLAVNAGSDSVSSFSIDDDRRNRSNVLTLAAGNLSTIDDGNTSTMNGFPVSIAEQGGIVYVLNAGYNGSVIGYNLDDDDCTLTPIAGSIRDFDFGNSNPPVFLDAPGDIQFTQNGEVLVFTVKNIRSGKKAGQVYGSQVSNDLLGPVNDFKVTSTEGVGAFSLVFDADENLLITEPLSSFPVPPPSSGGVSSYNVNSDGSIELVSNTTLTLEAATCWIVYAEACQCFYTSNNIGNSISALSVTDDGQTVKLIDNEVASLNAPIDMTTVGKYLYALSTGHTLDSLDVGPMNQTTGQPAVFGYEVFGDGSLRRVEVEFENLPTEFETGNGVAGLASC